MRRVVAQLQNQGAAFDVRRIISILSVALVVLSGALLYDTGIMVREALSFELPEDSIRNPLTSTKENSDKSLTDYAVISKRNVFGAAQIQNSTPTPSEPLKKTDLSLRLVGTHIGGGSPPFAIIEDTKKREQDIFDIDQTIFGQAKLTKIESERVQIEHGGEAEWLFLEESGFGGGGPPAGALTSTFDTPSADQTEFTVTQEELDDALANLPVLLSQARAVPYFRGGKSIGMRLFAIRKGSLYEKLGLKNGDIITSVNENSLSDPAQALKIFEELKSEQEIDVEVERNQRKMGLSYSIE